MQAHGTITKWNDGRGFGFIEISGTHEEIFVHISEFPRGVRPNIGELAAFTVSTKDGKKRALSVSLPGRPARKHTHHAKSSRTSSLWLAIAIFVIIGLGLVAYRTVSALYWAMNPVALARRDFTANAAIGKQPPFKCDQRKHCSQMKSCAEAVYFLDHCPGVMMDGDNDRRPCEEHICR